MTDFIPLHGEFLDAYNAKREEVEQYFACNHLSLVHNTRRVYSNNTEHIVQQCQGCGARIDKNLPRNKFTADEIAAMPMWNETLEDERAQQKREWLEGWRRHFYREQQKAKVERNRAYDQYLTSPEWQHKRRLVMKRANGICEGCGESRATQVHHTTYEHLYNEFLWELRAVCDACHERAHNIAKEDIA